MKTFAELDAKICACTGALTAKLDAMSPLKVLSRGYVITQDDKGEVVTTASSVQKGDNLSLYMQDGTVQCTVNQVTLKESMRDGKETDI